MRIEVRLHLPKKSLADIHVRDAIYNKQQSNTRKDVLKIFQGTVENWSNPPDFGTNQIVQVKRISIQIYPRGVFGGNNSPYKIYKIVTLGSPPHTIPSKRGRPLRFQMGYVSATLPGSLRSIKSQRFGSWMNTFKVNHPGFPGRHFDMFIAEEYKSTFYKDMQEAIDEVCKKEWGD